MEWFVQTIVQQEPWDFWITVAALTCGTVAGFFLWRRSLVSARVIEDVATSKVRSAAQGYVELCGSQHPCDDAPLSAPLTGRQCTWWFYHIEKKKKRRTANGKTRTEWVTVEKKASPHLIRFEDDTGDAIVNPTGAEVVAEVKKVWYGSDPRPGAGLAVGPGRMFGRYRYTEHIMRPGDPLYAIGHFETRTGELGPSEQRRQVTELLQEWKADQEALVEQFDADGDGAVDMHEWERAREAAERVIGQKVAEASSEPAVNLMLRPPDGRPFILSPKSQEELTKHYRGRSVLWMALFVVCGATLGAVLSVRFAGA